MPANNIPEIKIMDERRNPEIPYTKYNILRSNYTIIKICLKYVHVLNTD